MRQSKNTMALLAQFPTFQEWVVKNLTLTQIDEIGDSSQFEADLPASHPLHDEKFAAGIFRAYRPEVVTQIQYEFDDLDHFDMMRGGQVTFDASFHLLLLWAIVYMTQEFPEVLEQVVNDREPVSGD
jgi:hypothetical protein